MRTSVLVRRDTHATLFERCVLPDDSNPDEHPNRIERIVLKFRPAHTESGCSFGGKSFTRTVPDAIESYARIIMRLKRGATDDARVIAPELVDELDRLDREIERLCAARRQAEAEAWRRDRKSVVEGKRV